MEEQAREAARRAAAALQHSVAAERAAAPRASRFGPSRGSSSSAAASASSSGGLLAALRQRQSAVESGGLRAPEPDEGTRVRARLLAQIKEFVGRRGPSTDQVLERFEGSPGFDLAEFRALLQSAARLEGGRWALLPS
jgi:hypothetical protein